MKVIVLTSGEYSDYGINGVFSTRELAEKFAVNLDDKLYYEEWEVDEKVSWTKQTVYYTRLYLHDGSLQTRGAYVDIVRPHYTDSRVLLDYVLGKSVVSAEHADKIAAEARQEWLRNEG